MSETPKAPTSLRLIADQARIRRDLGPLRPSDEATIDLNLFAGRRAALACDRTRAVNRMRGALTSMFPGLERALELTNVGPLVLLTGYQTPAALRRLGTGRLAKWLRARKVRSHHRGRGCGATAQRGPRRSSHRHHGVHAGRGGDGPQ